MKKIKIFYSLLFILIPIITYLSIILSDYTGRFIDYISTDNISNILDLVLNYVIALIVFYLLSRFNNYFFYKFSFKISNYLKLKITKNIVYRDLIKNKSDGEILNLVQKDIQIIRKFLSSTIISIFYSFFLIIFIFYFIFSYNPYIFLVFVLWFFVSILNMLFFINKNNSNTLEENRKNEENLSKTLLETLKLSELILGLKKQGYFLERLKKSYQSLKITEVKQQKYLYKIWVLSLVVIRLGEILFLFLGGLMIFDGTLTIGQLFSIFLYIRIIKSPIENIQNLFQNALVTKNSYKRIKKYLVNIEESYPLNIKIKNLEIENLSLKYEDKIIFENINLKIIEGINYIYGPSGCGKSSVCKIIAGIEEKDGDIYYIDEINERKLYNASIYNNILYIDNEGIQLTEDIYFEINILNIQTLELEDYKDLDLNNIRILNIVRALHSNFEFIIFDETFANLKENIIEKLMTIIKNKFHYKTILIVDHNKIIENFADLSVNFAELELKEV
ncbi:MAG: ABC transporter ATP-binding protein/permease [Defluviitaleaceae bacterium]|nr:ABC transporter ATP-binding protein/permease [Defluviitaleaceae bacterium]